MNSLRYLFVAVFSAWLSLPCLVAGSGPYPPAAGEEGSTAVPMDDPAIVAWATGWTNFMHGTDLSADWTNVLHALGPASGDPHDVVSLGNGGLLTMTFDQPIVNGPGYDFAVFGNSFNDHFLELAYVEVSSDGVHFVRFHNVSLTEDPVPFFGAHMEPTLIDGFAGKYRVGFGMPFDLEELVDAEHLDVHNVRYVRLVDIIGDGSCLDAEGNPVYDPTPTEQSAGFDLEALAVMNQWTPLHAWRVQSFGTNAYSAAAADDAFWTDDGVPNILKYALDLDPSVAHTGSLFQWDWAEGAQHQHLKVTYERRAGVTEISLQVDAATSLNDWTQPALTFHETVEALANDRERVEAVSQEPAPPRLFLRMRGVRE